MSESAQPSQKRELRTTVIVAAPLVVLTVCAFAWSEGAILSDKMAPSYAWERWAMFAVGFFGVIVMFYTRGNGPDIHNKSVDDGGATSQEQSPADSATKSSWGPLAKLLTTEVLCLLSVGIISFNLGRMVSIISVLGVGAFELAWYLARHYLPRH